MKVNKKQIKTPLLRNQKRGGTATRRNVIAKVASRNQNLQGSVAAAYSTGNSGKAPQVYTTKDSSRVVHRELLGNVSGVGTSVFTVANTFALNPGIIQTFPWLSNMAQNWETYSFNSLRVCYYTRTGSNTAGSVILAPDYDASDAAPMNEQAISTFEDLQEDAPWKDICCVLKPASLHSGEKRKFVRSGALSVNQDIKLYDSGNLFVCTVDSAAAASWGKLWIEYDVTFFTPQLASFGSNLQNSTALGAVVMSAAAPFGTSPVIIGGLGATIAGNVITFPNLVVGAEYLLSVAIQGTGITVINFGTLVGLTSKSIPFNGISGTTSAADFNTMTATATSGSVVFNVTATTVSLAEGLFALIPTSTF